MTPEDVVRLRFPAGASLVKSVPLQAGRGNLGITVHTVRCRDGAEQRFVEKKTRKTREVEIARKLAQEPGGVVDLFPVILGVTDGADCHRLYLEHLPGTGRLPASESYAVRSISDAIVRLHRLPLDQYVDGDPSDWAVEAEQTSQALFAAALEGWPGADAAALAEEIAAMDRIYYDLPVVLSHNDLFLSNISSGVRRKGPVRFIDLGLMGPSVMGADLFGFARKSLRSERIRSLFHRLCAAYGQAMNCSPDQVEFVSFHQALRKSARKLQQHQKKGNGCGLQDERTAFEALLTRARDAYKRLPAGGG